MQIFVKLPFSKTLTIDCTPNSSIKKLRHSIFLKTKSIGKPILSANQNLRFGSKRLVNFCRSTKETQYLKSYNIQKESTIHCDYKWHTLYCKCNYCMNCIQLRSGRKVIKN